LKKPSIKTLKKKLDKLLSEYVRKRDKGQCCTCSRKDHWSKMQAGHFISRTKSGTRWLENNVHCQCVRCNIFLHGNMIEYYKFMEKKYGRDIIPALEQASKSSVDKDDILDFIDCYTKALKEI
jgi:5-methylcytosine-specific restriction endonuclease McrA